LTQCDEKRCGHLLRSFSLGSFLDFPNGSGIEQGSCWFNQKKNPKILVKIQVKNIVAQNVD
jgi:hypothetical protein